VISGTGRTYRFGVFLFDAASLELRRDGRSVRLQRQPAQVLAVLLDRAGELVTRDDLRTAIWGRDTFVDFDRGLNFCIAQIRTALGDDAGAPRYVRTSPKKGYEFICPLEVVAQAPESPTAPAAIAAAHGADARPDLSASRYGGRRLVAACVAAAAVAAIAAFVFAAARADLPIVAVARFDNETGDANLTRFSDYLTDSLVEQLTVNAAGRYRVVGNAAILRQPRTLRDLPAIAAALHADFVVIGQVQRDADHIRVLGHLIHLPEQTHVTVARFDDVPEQTLARTNEIALRMTENFARRLGEPRLLTFSSPRPSR
jgi:DNA-binding winged helix-turn-helix (wHTH) protein/TolB-like protein